MEQHDAAPVPPRPEGEEALVRRCQAGDPGAFEDLFRLYREDVFRFACQVVRDGALAQDVTQETFIKVYRSIRKFGFRSSFKSWLYRVTVNAGISLLRRRRAQEELLASGEDGLLHGPAAFGHPEEAAVAGEACWTLRGALAGLDPLHRTVVVLKYYHQLSDAEIARLLQCPTGTVKSRLHRARELLRRTLRPDRDERVAAAR